MTSGSVDEPGARGLAAVEGLSAGPVMVIGGAEDKLRDRVILNRFATYAGGADGHVVVISTASSLGDEATAVYGTILGSSGSVA